MVRATIAAQLFNHFSANNGIDEHRAHRYLVSLAIEKFYNLSQLPDKATVLLTHRDTPLYTTMTHGGHQQINCPRAQHGSLTSQIFFFRKEDKINNDRTLIEKFIFYYCIKKKPGLCNKTNMPAKIRSSHEA